MGKTRNQKLILLQMQTMYQEIRIHLKKKMLKIVTLGPNQKAVVVMDPKEGVMDPRRVVMVAVAVMDPREVVMVAVAVMDPRGVVAVTDPRGVVMVAAAVMVQRKVAVVAANLVAEVVAGADVADLQNVKV